MSKLSMKKTKKYLIGFGKLVMILLTTILIICPFYWMMVTSLKSESEIFKVPISYFPQNVTLENYKL